MKEIFKLSRVLAIAKKELMHILRDPFTIGLALGIPVIFTVFFGFAIDFDYRGIKMAVFDFDNSRQSREVAETFRASGYYKVFPGKNPGNPLLDVESERAFAALIINPEFAKKVVTGNGGKLQMLIDGTDNNKTSVVSGYMAGLFDSVLKRLTGQGAKTPVSFETKFLYNPELNTKWFVVPGLIVVLIGLLSILMTALTVAREWENGSMELLLSTPVKPLEIVIGKIAPYLVFVFLGIFLIYLLARVVFGVPFLGSNLLFWSGCLIYILTSLSEGLLISVITRQQQKAMQFSMVIGLLPSFILSGFIFPVENMPAFFNYLTMFFPPRWFMVIIRSIFLKGSGLWTLAVPFGALFVMSVVLIGLAVNKSKRDIEP